MKRTERLHALTETLRRSGSRGRSAEQLADEFGVSVRTIKRDLDALENSGSPIWARPGPGGGYGLAAGAHLPPITLTPSQAVALLAAVTSAADAPYADLAQAGIRKIMDALDPRTRQHADSLAQRIWVNNDAPVSRRIRSALEQAMVDQKVVRLHYTDATGDITIRDVEPMIFARRDPHWYLIGWCRLRDAVRWFRVARITRATVTRTPCQGHPIDEIGPPPATAAPVVIDPDASIPAQPAGRQNTR